MDNWIKITGPDSLPEIGTEVNVYVPSLNQVTSLCRLIRYEGALEYYWNNIYGGCNIHVQNAVSHWKPLPNWPILKKPQIDKWIRVEDALPDKETRYAAKYGVGVLYYDEQEARETGSCHPRECTFTFSTQQFLDLSFSGAKTSDWIPINVSHWMPMPLIPEELK